MKSFIKWVGGKQKLVKILLENSPKEIDTYYEPLLGGGSLFFALAKNKLIKSAVLSDDNLRLIRTYRVVRDNVEDLIEILSSYPNNSDFYYDLRSKNPENLSDLEMAAWFIYLNKTGFNGLYRVNKKNGFNVPFGKYKNPKICDEKVLREASVALQGVSITHQPFNEVRSLVGEGDFIYFDPPYIPLNETSKFTSYTSKGFGLKDHEKLRDVALEIKNRGGRVLISNSWSPYTLEVFKAFEIKKIEARRSVSADKNGRKKIYEALIF